MKPWIIVLIVLAVIAVILGLLYYFGKKAQTKQAAQQEQMEAMKQTVSMLIIDKKKLRMKDSGLPQMVIDQTPKMMRRAKLPIVKAKVGPRIMTELNDFHSSRVFFYKFSFPPSRGLTSISITQSPT